LLPSSCIISQFCDFGGERPSPQKSTEERRNEEKKNRNFLAQTNSAEPPLKNSERQDGRSIPDQNRAGLRMKQTETETGFPRTAEKRNKQPVARVLAPKNHPNNCKKQGGKNTNPLFKQNPETGKTALRGKGLTKKKTQRV